MPHLAVVQQPPVLLDRQGSVERLTMFARKAALEGANIVVFPEAFIPGYPSWIWRLRPGGDMNLSEELHAALLANAVSLEGDDLMPIRQAACDHGVHIVFGM